MSSLCIFIEHAFGQIKGRFTYLREISATDLTQTYCLIEALFILHNFLELLHDDPKEIDDFNGAPDESNEDLDVEEACRDNQVLGLDELYNAGVLRRKALVNLL